MNRKMMDKYKITLQHNIKINNINQERRGIYG